MNEYINRESIYKTLLMENPFGWNNDDLAELFRQAKPADVAPVRHGRWIKKQGGFWETATCSNCGENHPTVGIVPNYCPNCGADMRGENNVV